MINLREIFPLLLNNKLLHKVDMLVNTTFPKKLERLELQKESIEQKITLLHKHIDENHSLEGFDKNILQDLIFILAQTTLGHYEIFKTYIAKTLDFNELGITRKNPMFSEMVLALGKYKKGTVFHYDGLRMFFNVNISNVLAHDEWWFDENMEFTFKEPDNTIINFNVGELHGELAGINAIVLAFTENYMRNFDNKKLRITKNPNASFIH